MLSFCLSFRYWFLKCHYPVYITYIFKAFFFFMGKGMILKRLFKINYNILHAKRMSFIFYKYGTFRNYGWNKEILKL
jgi:hypothetical protein